MTKTARREQLRVLLISTGRPEGPSPAKFVAWKGDFVCADETNHPEGSSPAHPVRSGARPGMPVEPSRGGESWAGHQFVNAPARRCSVHRTALGQRFVRYQGGDYTVMGLYYVTKPWNNPCPFFVLRSIDGGDRAAVSAWSGEPRELRPASLFRTLAHAVIIAILLSLPAWIGPKLHVSVPPAAHVVAPFTMPGVPAGSRRASISRSTPPRGGSVDRHSATAAGVRRGRARMSHPSRRRPYTANRPRSKMTASYAVSFGTFRDGRQAGAVARRVRAMGYRATTNPAGVGIRVRGHRYPTRANAAHMVRIFRKIGLPASVEVVDVGRA
jgi:hypothetical protein